MHTVIQNEEQTLTKALNLPHYPTIICLNADCIA